MTYEKALKHIKDLINNVTSAYYDCLAAGGTIDDEDERYLDVLQKAAEALEKQIPKKPYITERSCVDTYCCNNCKGSLYYVDRFKEDFALREMLYCDECGQAIDWSEQNG